MYGPPTIEDEQGNMFCAAHRKEYCHVCTCDFRGQNAYFRGEITVDEIADYGEVRIVSISMHLDTG
jgi:hypothetical protein